MSLAHNFEEGTRTNDVRICRSITFRSMLLAPATLQGLEDSGFHKPSPIQLHAIPMGKCGFDLMLEAKSGTGKTAVFSVIALEKLDLRKGLQAIILAPTREIAAQVCDVIKHIGSSYEGLEVAVVMGGLPVKDDIERFQKKVHIVVGSPGRLRQLIHEKHIDVSAVRLLVFDEADRLVDKSFLADINYIFSSLPQDKQVIMSSATYSENAKELITKYMQSAQHICPETDSILLGIEQRVTIVKSNVNIVKQTQIRFEELLKIISRNPFKQCLIFCNYQARVGEVSKMLRKEKWPVEQLYGQQEQTDRLEALKTLQLYRCRILVATDLAARGIDASNVDLVINFEPPFEWQTYLHRIGRAGRFGAYGTAITILTEGKEENKFKTMVQEIRGTINMKRFWDDEIFLDETTNMQTTKPETELNNIPEITNNGVESQLTPVTPYNNQPKTEINNNPDKLMNNISKREINLNPDTSVHNNNLDTEFNNNPTTNNLDPGDISQLHHNGGILPLYHNGDRSKTETELSNIIKAQNMSNNNPNLFKKDQKDTLQLGLNSKHYPDNIEPRTILDHNPAEQIKTKEDPPYQKLWKNLTSPPVSEGIESLDNLCKSFEETSISHIESFSDLIQSFNTYECNNNNGTNFVHLRQPDLTLSEYQAVLRNIYPNLPADIHVPNGDCHENGNVTIESEHLLKTQQQTTTNLHNIQKQNVKKEKCLRREKKQLNFGHNNFECDPKYPNVYQLCNTKSTTPFVKYKQEKLESSHGDTTLNKENELENANTVSKSEDSYLPEVKKCIPFVVENKIEIPDNFHGNRHLNIEYVEDDKLSESLLKAGLPTSFGRQKKQRFHAISKPPQGCRPIEHPSHDKKMTSVCDKEVENFNFKHITDICYSNKNVAARSSENSKDIKPETSNDLHFYEQQNTNKNNIERKTSSHCTFTKVSHSTSDSNSYSHSDVDDRNYIYPSQTKATHMSSSNTICSTSPSAQSSDCAETTFTDESCDSDSSEELTLSTEYLNWYKTLKTRTRQLELAIYIEELSKTSS